MKGRVDIATKVILESHSTLRLLSNKIDLKTAEIIFLNLYKSVEKLSNKKGNEDPVIKYDDWKNELLCIQGFTLGFFSFSDWCI
jgi:hypothetical protein